jgi:hypothetical protein
MRLHCDFFNCNFGITEKRTKYKRIRFYSVIQEKKDLISNMMFLRFSANAKTQMNFSSKSMFPIQYALADVGLTMVRVSVLKTTMNFFRWDVLLTLIVDFCVTLIFIIQQVGFLFSFYAMELLMAYMHFWSEYLQLSL